ncbi:MAG TPA: DUF1592 domain-containing protein [Verrucomicrobiae bacterium]|nr:DUF1592 domain-containing protein [Verrucomicrobiae bacterium]
MPMRLPIYVLACLAPVLAAAGPAQGAADFHKHIRPLLETYCFDCHADGVNKGNVAFDEFASDQAAVDNRDLWLRAFKMLRAGLMPPAKKPHPSTHERAQVLHWIKRDVFAIDPANPNPGRVTLRRLNRVEYRNTIHDLLGVDFDALSEFPPDDTGFGFDNIGQVLTLPPMLLEKYLTAADEIMTKVQENWTHPGGHEHFFPRATPTDDAARREYARQLLEAFAGKAFRRPVEPDTLERLVNLAEATYRQPGKTFEAGVAEAMIAVLASPHFLFHEEAAEPANPRQHYAFVDQFSLASRLSYFLWSSMPDDELLHLAASGSLRKDLATQVERMLKDPRSDRLVRNFTGQWLRGRDIETVPSEARFILAREEKASADFEPNRRRLRELRDKNKDQLTQPEREELSRLRAEFRRRLEERVPGELTGELRRAMRRETEMVFSFVLHQDRPLLELLDSDYTFLNEPLARQYGLTNVLGPEMRLVRLPPGSPRGGVLTEGTVLVTTSNPTRTSPVKRGAFILENILGTPVPPPPPNLPPLEDAAKGLTNHTPTLRETLALHRQNSLCASCHNRMDPLGLAFENFNALGMWRTTEFQQPLDTAGQLITGESFTNPNELKQLLLKDHAGDFYRTLTEKFLTYALGRGLEYYDVETVDQIVARIQKSGGRSSALLAGIIESAPFEKIQNPSVPTGLGKEESHSP